MFEFGTIEAVFCGGFWLASFVGTLILWAALRVRGRSDND